MLYKLVSATNKMTHKPTQEKYIGTIGIVNIWNPIMFLTCDKAIGSGFVTSDVKSKIFEENKVIVETQNSIYIFEEANKYEYKAAYEPIRSDYYETQRL